jgi:hypothetical protein
MISTTETFFGNFFYQNHYSLLWAYSQAVQNQLKISNDKLYAFGFFFYDFKPVQYY